ncbi:MAG: sodium:solute symporter [Bacteroidota bacterium]|nr:sodium:solute symporter [Bacteroidota bacterium]
MSSTLIILCILGYFGFLLLIAWFTSRNSNADSYFIGNKSSPWYAVAFGMLGDSLSGVTYISVPGAVNSSGFSYMQLVLGYFFGYLIISHVLLPLYYKMNLLSIYTYLEKRFGRITQKTGASFFILSRILGAAGRLFLAAGVIQYFVFDRIDGMHVPFAVSVSVIIALMLLYTYKGGIKTLVWTDTFQSLFLILGVILSIVAIMNHTGWSVGDSITKISDSGYSKMFFWDWKATSFFPKQFLGGIFIAVTMTGLDQNMMQKNLSMKSLGEAQKNMFWFSIVLIIVNIFFLALGAMLYLYYNQTGVALPMNAETGKVITDKVFPNLALNHLGIFAGLVFIIGLTAATFSSADSVLTTLTTSMYVDMFELDKKEKLSDKKKANYRHVIHIGFAVVLWAVILIFEALNNSAIIDTILKIAGYTYGPLLGLFSYGLIFKMNLRDKLVPLVCVVAPIFCYTLSTNSKAWFGGYEVGNELIIWNGLITLAGLLAITKFTAKSIKH